MAKIAVYDKFFESEVYPDSDIVGLALQHEAFEGVITHEVLGNTANLRKAAEQIIYFSTLEEEAQPDVVVIGGMLFGESEYREVPAAVTEECLVRRRTWLGGVKEQAGTHRTFLLPQFEANRKTYKFPSIVTVGKVPETIPPELVDEYYSTVSSISGLVLSRVAETYLPHARRLGVSKFLMMEANLSEDNVIRDERGAVERLRVQLQGDRPE